MTCRYEQSDTIVRTGAGNTWDIVYDFRRSKTNDVYQKAERAFATKLKIYSVEALEECTQGQTTEKKKKCRNIFLMCIHFILELMYCQSALSAYDPESSSLHFYDPKLENYSSPYATGFTGMKGLNGMTFSTMYTDGNLVVLAS